MPSPGRRFRPFAAITEAFAAEAERHVLWLPVFFATGIAFYFTLTIEPPPWLGIAATVIVIPAAFLARRIPLLRGMAIALAFAAAGFAIVQEARWGARHADAGAAHRLGRDHRHNR